MRISFNANSYKIGSVLSEYDTLFDWSWTWQ